MPDVPESVVARLREHEDYGLDADEDQARDHTGLDPTIAAAGAPVDRGDKCQDEKWAGLKQRVEPGEMTPDDQGRQNESEPSRERDGGDTHHSATARALISDR